MDIPDQYCADFHESANRPHLLVGCEPTPVALLVMICVAVAISVPTWWGLSGDLFLFLFGREVLRQMAKKDPKFMAAHFESQRYNQKAWTAKPRRAIRWRSK